MSLFPCCASQKRLNKKTLKKSIKKEKEYEDRRSVTSFSNISFKSDSGKRKFITDEIARLGKGNIRSKIISYREICAATQNFHPDNMIGEGGFGRVYKGYLKSTNQTVAVKQLDRNGFQGTREFLVEVLILSLLHHPNLVNLIGYCAEGEHRILVYEYMVNGSLEDHLLVAAMCLQEEDETRPLISDVVTAVEFLARKRVEENEPQPTKKISSTEEEEEEEEEDSNEHNQSHKDRDDNHNDQNQDEEKKN
ncbi:hypothetical protein V8G54_032036 [Vigna mungo]|uniref:non-specific serine/threonine protein kinase n=1 Tax=Vigna mungo TaxID=3915 RepID=A0AAQ3MLH0_VIGMU